MSDLYSHNPVVVFYLLQHLLQASAYGAAAAMARRGNHNALCICYLASAILHVLLGAGHLIYFG